VSHRALPRVLGGAQSGQLNTAKLRRPRLALWQAGRRITLSIARPQPSAAAFPLTRSLTPACHALMHTAFLLWARGHGLSVWGSGGTGALPFWVARRTTGNGLNGTAEREQEQSRKKTTRQHVAALGYGTASVVLALVRVCALALLAVFRCQNWRQTLHSKWHVTL
jgi:hypothetical protein